MSDEQQGCLTFFDMAIAVFFCICVLNYMEPYTGIGQVNAVVPRSDFARMMTDWISWFFCIVAFVIGYAFTRVDFIWAVLTMWVICLIW